MAGNARILTVKILTDASDASKGLSKASSSYNKFGNAIGAKSQTAGVKAGNKLVSGIDKTLGVGLKVVGAGAGLLAATALTKGFQRLQAIDTAKAKLRGLGNSAADVAKIMKNANAAVLGTAYGLDEAAGVAAQAVAAGIQPGKQLEGVLTNVADAAAQTGMSMTDMGSIFAKVAAKNKLQGDVMDQLQSASIPILSLLQKHYGITADAASDMVSKGKVDFKNFSAAMKEGFGGSAQKAGKTFKGALANVESAIGRVGAAFLGPLFEDAKSGLSGIPALLKPIEKIAGDAGKKLSDLFGWMKDNPGTVKAIAVAIGVLAGAMLVFRAAVAATNVVIWLQTAAWLANPMVWIIALIVAVVAAFVILWVKCEAFRNFFIGMWDAIVAAVTAAVNFIVTVSTTVWTAVTAAVAASVAWIRGAIGAVGSFVAGVWNMIVAVAVAAWSGVKGAVAAVAAWIRSALAAIGGFVAGIWNTIASGARASWNGIKAVVSGVAGGIRSAVSSLGSFVKSIWTGISSAGRKAWNALKGVAMGVLDAIMVPVHALERAFDAVVSAVRSVIGWISKIHLPNLGAIAKLIPGLNATAGVTSAAPTTGQTDFFDAPLIPRVGATAGGSGVTIMVNGGLDSGDTIARRIKKILSDDDRRNGGVRMVRRAAV